MDVTANSQPNVKRQDWVISMRRAAMREAQSVPVVIENRSFWFGEWPNISRNQKSVTAESYAAPCLPSYSASNFARADDILSTK